MDKQYRLFCLFNSLQYPDVSEPKASYLPLDCFSCLSEAGLLRYSLQSIDVPSSEYLSKGKSFATVSLQFLDTN